jgi:transcription elongation factor GreA
MIKKAKKKIENPTVENKPEEKEEMYLEDDSVSAENEDSDELKRHEGPAFSEISPTEKITFTKKGLEILKSELKELKSIKRPEISERIRQARALGDISENSEYEEAKREQGFVEARVLELERMLQSSVIIDESDATVDVDKVRVGSVVVLENMLTNQNEEFKIVSTLEAEPLDNIISNMSPFGTAMIGHKVGEVVRVISPNGLKRYKILEIHRDTKN